MKRGKLIGLALIAGAAIGAYWWWQKQKAAAAAAASTDTTSNSTSTSTTPGVTLTPTDSSTPATSSDTSSGTSSITSAGKEFLKLAAKESGLLDKISSLLGTSSPGDLSQKDQRKYNSLNNQLGKVQSQELKVADPATYVSSTISNLQAQRDAVNNLVNPPAPAAA